MYKAMDFRGLTINSGLHGVLHDEYADQLFRSTAGSCERSRRDTVPGSEELCAKPGSRQTLRYARHRGQLRPTTSRSSAGRIKTCWQHHQRPYLLNLSREESDARCRVLEEMAVGLMSNGSALDGWFNDVTRPRFFH